MVAKYWSVLHQRLNGISVVTSTYNEKDNIEKLIPRIRNILKNVQREVIVVDDSSPDGTYLAAKELADIAVSKKREGQTRGIAIGVKHARHATVVTIDADLENDPEYIPSLLDRLQDFDIVVASRDKLPRFSERLFSLLFREKLGVQDILSNYRAFKKCVADRIDFGHEETYGAEFLIKARRIGFRIGEITVELRRRGRPRLGNRLTANLKILLALVRSVKIYFRSTS